MIIEIIFNSIVPIPGTNISFKGTNLGSDYELSLDNYIFIVMLLKGYHILRIYGQYSRWTSDKAVRICRKFKVTADVMFAIKAELKYRPYHVLGIILFLTVIYLGISIRTYEMLDIHPFPFYPD